MTTKPPRAADASPRPLAVAHSPVLVMLAGLPGTGKSTFAQALSERVALHVIESDAVRERMFASPTHAKSESRHVFDSIHQEIGRRLENGESVLVDATNLIEAERAIMYRIAESRGARLVIVRLTAAAAVVRQRIVARSRQRAGRLAADTTVYNRMRLMRQPIPRPHYVVDTATDIRPAVEALAGEITNV